MSEPKWKIDGWTKLGRYFGYPDCCVKAFCYHPYKLSDYFFPQTGFRPCKECVSDKGGLELLLEVRHKRICKVPFPDEPDLEFFEVFWNFQKSGKDTSLMLGL